MSEARQAHAAALRLRAHYNRAPNDLRRAGRAWYPHATRVASQLADEAPNGIGAAGCAAVIATLSPRLRWGHNVADAAAMIRAAGRSGALLGDLEREGAAFAAARYALPDRIRLAAGILAGDALARQIGLRGPKVGAFYRAIRGDRDAVTLDVWAARAARGSWDWADNLTARRHRILTSAYERAAAMVGEAPRDFQAIVWLQVRGVKPSDARAMVTP